MFTPMAQIGIVIAPLCATTHHLFGVVIESAVTRPFICNLQITGLAATGVISGACLWKEISPKISAAVGRGAVDAATPPPRQRSFSRNRTAPLRTQFFHSRLHAQHRAFSQ
jgi:hypothetical protein